MTTLPATVTTADEEITEFVTEICRLGPASRYAYATGYLSGIIRALADLHNLHNRCRTKDCPACGQIRRGLALMAALDRVDADALGGAR
jgi:hypothetical protein